MGAGDPFGILLACSFLLGAGAVAVLGLKADGDIAHWWGFAAVLAAALTLASFACLWLALAAGAGC